LIEPTGIGHPKQIIRQLSQSPFDKILAMQACITMIDPRHLQDTRYTENEYYREQLEVADVLAANKIDQCTESDIDAFEQLLNERRPAASGKVSHGQIDPAWLGLPHTQRPQSSLLQVEPLSSEPDVGDISLEPGEICRREENQLDSFFSCGWLFDKKSKFNKTAVLNLFSAIEAERIKAALHTDQGDFIFNAGPDGIQDYEKENLEQNRVELIVHQTPDWDKIEAALISCMMSV
jgi:G3E family GTPase